MVHKIIACGNQEFTQKLIDACQGSPLTVVAAIASVTDLAGTITSARPEGVVAPAEADWVDALIRMADQHRSAACFIVGLVDKARWNELQTHNILLLPSSLTRTVRSIAMTLERVSPTAYRPVDGPRVISPNRGNKTLVPVEVPKVVDPQFHVIWGPKSAGRSVVAAGIAALVARRLQKFSQQGSGRARVALIDLDVEGGDVGTFLGLPPDVEGLEPLSRTGLIDGAAIRRSVRNTLGVDILPAGPYPSQIILAERFAGLPDQAEGFAARILAAAQTEYPFVLVDVPGPLAHPFTFTALTNAKEVLFVVRPGRAGLRRAISVLETAWQCGLHRTRFRLIVNGKHQGGIDPGEIAGTLGLKLTATLPADVAGFLAAETQGRPYALGERAEWGRLADLVFPVRETQGERLSPLASIFKGVARLVAADHSFS